MGSEAIIIGAGILLISFIYMLFKLGEAREVDNNGQPKNKHFLLQLLVFFFIFMLVLLLGKATHDSSQNCDWLEFNRSTVYRYGDNFSAYHWDYLSPPPTFLPNDDAAFLFHTYEKSTWNYTCEPSAFNTDETFYKVTTWFAYIGILYVFLYFMYEVFKFIGWVVPKEKGSEEFEGGRDD